jgi:hypothetical protein
VLLLPEGFFPCGKTSKAVIARLLSCTRRVFEAEVAAVL